VEIFADEGPLEGRGGALVVCLESQKPVLEFGPRTEVVGSANLSLYNREVDLDLVEPTSVDRSVHKNGIGPLGSETVDGLLPTMNGTIVHNPEEPMGGAVVRLAHDLTDEARYRDSGELNRCSLTSG
jgi:hypothetical protein